MNPSVASWLPTVLFVPLVALLLYRRVKRTFGRQPVSPARMTLRMLLLCAVSVLLLAGMPTARGFVAAAVGAGLGAVLARYGLRHTRFEATAEGKFYTPNPWIGLIVAALLLGRLAARVFSLYEAGALDGSGRADAALQRSPLTLGIFFLMAAYYVAYYAGVLRGARALDITEPPRG